MSDGLVVALSGGIGGAKLALGLSRVLPADELLVVANTGDDFEHLGLSISPAGSTRLKPSASLAPPMPPDSATTRPLPLGPSLTGTCPRWLGESVPMPGLRQRSR